VPSPKLTDTRIGHGHEYADINPPNQPDYRLTEIVEVSRDTPDWTLMSFWAHPERVLDPVARASTSGFARMPDEVVERVVGAVEEDLSTGAWDRRYGHLRELDAFDAGLRLVVSTPV
jgi:hypothetical protein